jgi:hypothetical protein
MSPSQCITYLGRRQAEETAAQVEAAQPCIVPPLHIKHKAAMNDVHLIYAWTLGTPFQTSHGVSSPFSADAQSLLAFSLDTH